MSGQKVTLVKMEVLSESHQVVTAQTHNPVLLGCLPITPGASACAPSSELETASASDSTGERGAPFGVRTQECHDAG